MCTASAALAAQGAGAASSAVGSYYSAAASKRDLNLRADLAEINAKSAESAAQATLLSGQRETQRSMIATAQLKAKQRTGLAANGVDLGVGSAANILTTTDVMGEVDANTIEANAVRGAWGQRMQSVDLQNQARSSRAAAGAISPGMSAVGSLLGSAGQVASSWYSMNKAGAFDVPASTSAGTTAGSGLRARANVWG